MGNGLVDVWVLYCHLLDAMLLRTHERRWVQKNRILTYINVINYMKTRDFPTSMEGLTTHNGRSAAYSMKLGSL